MFLSENEVREVIRRRIIVYEATKLTKVQELLLFEQSGGGTGLSTIISAIQAVQTPGSLQAILPYVVDISAILLGAGGTYAILTLPLGHFAVYIGAIAALAGGVYALRNYMQGKLADADIRANPQALFLNDTVNNPIRKFAADLASGINSKQIKMPKLGADFDTTYGITPSSNLTEYQAALEAARLDLEAQGGGEDFLGIPISEFEGELTEIEGCTAFKNPKVNIVETAKNFLLVLHDSGNPGGDGQGDGNVNNDAPEKALDKLFENPDITLYDLWKIDRRVGKLVKSNTVNLLFDDDVSLYGNHFDVNRSQFVTESFNNASQSNIFYLLVNYNVSLSNFKTEQINAKIAAKIPGGIDTAFQKTLLPFKQNIHDEIEPYLLGKPISELGAHGKFGQDYTFIGSEFFENLEPSLLQVAAAKLLEFLGTIWDAIKYGLTTSFNWTKEKLSTAYDWWKNNIMVALTAIGGILAGGVEGIAEAIGTLFSKIGEFFSWLLSSDGGDIEGGGSEGSETVTGGEDEVSAGRSGNVTSGRRYNDVESMQKVMNRYLQKYNLAANPTDEDGRWGSDTDRLWDVVVNHAFDNHPVFSNDPDQDRYNDGHHKWGDMSLALQDDNGPKYVGYTSRPAGALAMVLDMFNGNVEFGNGKQLPDSIGPGTVLDDSDKGPGGEGETETSAGREVDPTLGSGTPKSTKTGMGERGVRIRVETGKTGINTLEDMGFDPGTTRAVSLKVIEGIKKPNFSGTDNEGIVLRVNFNRSGKVRLITLGGVQKLSELLAFKFGTLKSIKTLLAAQGGTIDKDEVNYKNFFNMTVTVPGGVKNV